MPRRPLSTISRVLSLAFSGLLVAVAVWYLDGNLSGYNDPQWGSAPARTALAAVVVVAALATLVANAARVRNRDPEKGPSLALLLMLVTIVLGVLQYTVDVLSGPL